MKSMQAVKPVVGAITALAVTVGAGTLLNVRRAEAQSPNEAAQIAQGMAFAPVKLNMIGKDPNLVGYGSYIVNALSDCNGCHSNGPATEYATGGNPYFAQHPQKVDDLAPKGAPTWRNPNHGPSGGSPPLER
jgi:hypothetical protein